MRLRKSDTDVLTLLPNRSYLATQVDRLLLRKPLGESALLCININRFRHLDDALGSAIGDSILRHVSNKIRDTVREMDLVAKGNGGEFFVLLGGLKTLSNIQRVANKLLRAFAEPLTFNGEPDLQLSVSIGCTVIQRDGISGQELLKNAEIAAHRAKESPDENVHFFSVEMGRGIARSLAIESGLRQALKRGQLKVAYQPRVNLHNHRIAGYEALLRWNSDSLGSVSPVEFIPIAEESGLIIPIGAWVLQQACMDAKAWQIEFGEDTKIAVNVSTAQFLHNDFSSTVFAALDSVDLDGSSLELEITESLLLANIEKVRQIIKTLSSRGVTVALDDFGTGYCGMQYLKLLNANTLKIDRAFVKNIPGDKVDSAIARAVVALADSVGMSVIAEGVETPEQWDFLKKCGCDEVQGYLIAEPMPAGTLRARFLERSALFVLSRQAAQPVVIHDETKKKVAN